VCSGCKTSAERAVERPRIAEQAQTRVPSSTVPTEECGAAAGPSVATVVGAPSGLHVLSKSAATAMHLQVPPRALSGPPLLVAADDPTGGSHQCASASACRASDQTATDTALSQEPRKPEGLSHAHDTPRVSAVPGSVSVHIPPDVSWQSTERYLAALLDRYDSLAVPELATLDTLIYRHLAATRPPDISVVFKIGVKRTYVWVRSGRGTDVGDRHLRRRVAALQGQQARITGDRTSTYASAHARILWQAQAVVDPALKANGV